MNTQNVNAQHVQANKTHWRLIGGGWPWTPKSNSYCLFSRTSFSLSVLITVCASLRCVLCIIYAQCGHFFVESGSFGYLNKFVTSELRGLEEGGMLYKTHVLLKLPLHLLYPNAHMFNEWVTPSFMKSKKSLTLGKGHMKTWWDMHMLSIVRLWT